MEMNQLQQASLSDTQQDPAIESVSTAQCGQSAPLAEWELMLVGGGEMLPCW